LRICVIDRLISIVSCGGLRHIGQLDGVVVGIGAGGFLPSADEDENADEEDEDSGSYDGRTDDASVAGFAFRLAGPERVVDADFASAGSAAEATGDPAVAFDVAIASGCGAPVGWRRSWIAARYVSVQGVDHAVLGFWSIGITGS